MEEKKFYQKNWFVILTLIFVFPIGLYLMWRHTDWKPKTKKIVTGIVGFIFVLNLFSSDDESKSDVSSTTNIEEPKTEEISKDNETKEEKERKEKENLEAKKKEEEKKAKEQEEKERKEKEQKEKEQKEKEEQEEKEKQNQEEAKKKKEQEEDSKNLSPIGLEEVTVAKFVDGDTTRFYYNGEDVSFRYLLIDTPETKHPRVGKQPFGPEASARTQELLSNASVIEVEHDIGEKVDKYDRHLAYIWADGVMVNEVLVREGLAQVNYVYPPNTRHLDRLKEAERLAKEEGLGIWSLPLPFDDESYSSKSQSQSSGSNSGGGTSGSSNSIDHGGGQSPDTNSNAPTSFQNCTKLREWYPNGVGSDHPAYAPKHDRDKDGWACEQ